MGVRASDEIKQERIAGAMGEEFDEISFPFSILKWAFATQGNSIRTVSKWGLPPAEYEIYT